MSIERLLDELNPRQREAATLTNQHALVLAGAGAGKTKTIIARAAYLISSGIPASRIRILTFTRRSASEIVERVKNSLGEKAQGLGASTFHAWCMSLLHSGPESFGVAGLSIIDRDDQLQLYKLLRGKKKKGSFPSASELCDLYSFARNTCRTLPETIELKAVEFIDKIDVIGKIMSAYEEKKNRHYYLDYDDILDFVAAQMSESEEVREWIASLYDCILIDETQDTNPLQWKLLHPLKDLVPLFAVGDDAQSIYGFRGADFRNIHLWSERVPGSSVLKLEDNYRSTQGILDVANWLLRQSPFNYDKTLNAVRGEGIKPKLCNFQDEWQEGGWIVSDLQERYGSGAPWRDHMVLVRSSSDARVIESFLVKASIPYRFIGGMKLLESAHIKDVMSVLRLVANPYDEIAAMRFLTLWQGVGDVRATKLVNMILDNPQIEYFLDLLVKQGGLDKSATEIIRVVHELQTDVAMAFRKATEKMATILEQKYRDKEWDKRRCDFKLVEKLAEKHSSILGFIEEYLLDPLHGSQIDTDDKDDTVTVITVHSAKGTECKTCYVVNVSPGAYPSSYATNEEEVEEERRVLYVALTRAIDELIVTRRSFTNWGQDRDNCGESYFLNAVPDDLFDEVVVKKKESPKVGKRPPVAKRPTHVGIKLS